MTSNFSNFNIGSNLTAENLLGNTTQLSGFDNYFDNIFNESNFGFENSTSKFGNTTDTGFSFGGQGGANIAAGLQGLGSLANAFAAYKKYKLGKQQLAQNKQAFNLNFANQAKVTNAEIDDRARRRAFERSDITGDLDAIAAAAEAEAGSRRVNGKGIS